jgi:hypothetical protein
MIRPRRLLPLLLAAILDPAHAGDIAGPQRIGFDEATAGAAPPGFTTAVTGPGAEGEWIVEENPGAPSGTRILVQRSHELTSARFPLCIYDAFVSSDAAIEVAFQTLSGSVDQAAGIVWRYKDARNYYVVRANALEGNVVLYKVENGKRSDLDPIGSGPLTYGSKAPVARNQWQRLRVDVRGARFAVFLNGEALFEVHDSTFPGPGRVGLWTKADSVTAFDDLKIDP